ncbi:MAG: GNAT family N-acetyltransferase [Candidatus Latescibacteria bacterium]|nr:GNAT family N-acetyltransferase [Candidatus Latescibacterota bacterium]
MKMEVVQALNSDIPAILEIWKELMDFHVPFDSRYTLADGAEESMGKNLERLIAAEDALVIMAVENTKPMGFGIARIDKYPPVFVKQTCGTIEDLAVSSGHRRRGIGELVLKEMLDWFQSWGIDRVELRVASMNTVGYSFTEIFQK